jgi:uncharacterized protein (DUF2336 family)
MNSAPPEHSPGLGLADVAQLAGSSAPQIRVETVGKVGEQIRLGGLSPEAQQIAVDILTRFAADAEIAVREAVAWQFRNNDRLPGDLALRLADDVARVAAPVLRHYAGFGDDVLLRVVAGGDQEKMQAVAERPTVSPVVSEAIAGSGNIRTVALLVANAGARISEPAFTRIVERFDDAPEVAEPMARRPNLPSSVAWRLIGRVSDAVARDMAARHRIPPAVLEQCVARGREAVMMQLIRPILADGPHLRGFLEQLRLERRLTAELLFRALCAGDLAVFITGMAVLCNVTREAAREMVFDRRPMGLEAAFRRAGLKAWLAPAFRVALDVARGWQRPLDDAGRRDFQIEVMARVFAHCGDSEEPDVAELLVQMFDTRQDGMIAEAVKRMGAASTGIAPQSQPPSPPIDRG